MSFEFFMINKLSPDFRCGVHGHPCWEIALNIESRGTVFFGDRGVPYGPDEVMVHAPLAAHLCHNEGATTHYCLGLSGPALGSLREGVFAADAGLRTAFESVAAEANGKGAFFKELVELGAQEIALRLRRIQADGSPSDEIPSGISHMKTIIDTEYQKRIDLTFLSNEVMLSVDYIRHEFKKRYGLSPIQYLINKRVDYAKHLLATSGMSVKQIAYQCGFENEYYFSRIFKRVTGISPSAHREDLERRYDETVDAAPDEGR